MNWKSLLEQRIYSKKNFSPKVWRWIAWAVGVALLLLSTKLLLFDLGPQYGPGASAGTIAARNCFSPLVWGMILALSLALLNVLRRDTGTWEWLPALAVTALLWSQTDTPVWFSAYPDHPMNRMPMGMTALVCIGVLTALGTMAGKQRTRGSAARMAWLLGAVLLSCAGDLLYEVMHEVEASTMKAMITWKNPWPFAAMHWGVPLLRLLGGLPSIFLMKRNPAGGAVLLAVGLAGCLLCLLEWFGVPLSIAAGQNRTLTVFALLLFGGIRCVLPERNLVCQSKS